MVENKNQRIQDDTKPKAVAYMHVICLLKNGINLYKWNKFVRVD